MAYELKKPEILNPDLGVEPAKVYDKIWLGKNSCPNSTVWYAHKVLNDDILYIRWEYIKEKLLSNGGEAYINELRKELED